MQTRAEPLGWRPGLDGIRGVAILMVMLFHFQATRAYFPCGSLGVDVFFVLSGFLITTLLLEERSRTGAVSLSNFYRRRGRRLLPALGVFLAVFAAVSVSTAQPGTSRLPATLLAGIFYVFNWLPALGLAPTGGSWHIWSLSVEEQFYIVWPLAMMLALRVGPRSLLAVSVLLFAISASLPAWSGRSYESLYYGTDFRVQALMAGGILAQFRFSGAITPSLVDRVPFRVATLLSIVTLGAFLLMVKDRPTFLHSGLYTVVAIASAVLVCAALYSPPRVLTNRVIRYVGSRSYALYLWHSAIAIWLPEPSVLNLGLSFGLSLAAAEASWRLVEQPHTRLVELVAVPLRRLRAAVAPSSASANAPAES